MNNFLITPIEFLKGVGPQRADLLRSEIGIYTFQDLLEYYPFRYVDRSEFQQVTSLTEHDGFAQLKGRIIGVMETGVGRTKRLTAKFQDETGVIDLVWFKGARWIKSSLEANKDLMIYGRPKLFKGKWNIPHPEISKLNLKDLGGFQAVYPSTEKLTSRGLNSKGNCQVDQNCSYRIKSTTRRFTLRRNQKRTSIDWSHESHASHSPTCE